MTKTSELSASLPVSSTTALDRSKAADASARATTSASRASDSTALSAASTTFAQALGQDDARLDKVSALRQKIQDGSYNVPSEAVAGSVVNAMLSAK